MNVQMHGWWLKMVAAWNVGIPRSTVPVHVPDRNSYYGTGKHMLDLLYIDREQPRFLNLESRLHYSSFVAYVEGL